METKGRLIAGSHNRNEFVLINADEIARVSATWILFFSPLFSVFCGFKQSDPGKHCFFQYLKSFYGSISAFWTHPFAYLEYFWLWQPNLWKTKRVGMVEKPSQKFWMNFGAWLDHVMSKNEETTNEWMKYFIPLHLKIISNFP